MKPIIGMIHLANGPKQALEEIALYEQNGIAGAIVENYHASVEDVKATLALAQARGFLIPLGVNILPNDYLDAAIIANDYGASFVQVDAIAGKYQKRSSLALSAFAVARKEFPQLQVLGGVWPKYYTPVDGSDFAQDISDACARADVLVVTGAGTGKQTPLEKIQFMRAHATKPVYIGAGLTTANASAQLEFADGAIVGSYFKDGDTSAPVIESRVAELMAVVRSL